MNLVYQTLVRAVLSLISNCNTSHKPLEECPSFHRTMQVRRQVIRLANLSVVTVVTVTVVTVGTVTVVTVAIVTVVTVTVLCR